MKKVLILTLILIMLTTSLVFAGTFDDIETNYNYRIEMQAGEYTWLLLSQNPIQRNQADTSYNFGQNSKFMKLNASRQVISSTTLSDGHTGINFSIPITWSSHNIYYTSTTNLFYSPPTPYTQGMEGAQQNLLQSLLVILPIIAGGVVLLIGFRKALTLLYRSLAKA